MYLLASDCSKLTIDTYQVLRDRISGLTLTINVSRESTNFDALETYFNNIVDNGLNLEVYNDSDEKEQSLRGFGFELYIGVNHSLFNITLKCDSENTYQIGILQDRATKQEDSLSAHDNTLSQHTEAITAQSNEIETQKQTSSILVGQSITQSDTLDVIISEVIPTAIEVAIESSMAMMMEQIQALLTPPVEEEVPEEEEEIVDETEEVPTEEPTTDGESVEE